MKQCPQCGRLLGEDSLFCPGCGRAQSNVPAQTAVPVAAPAHESAASPAPPSAAAPPTPPASMVYAVDRLPAAVKQKHTGKWIWISLAALLGLALIVLAGWGVAHLAGSVLPVGAAAPSELPLVYLSEGDTLQFLLPGSEEPVVITESFRQDTMYDKYYVITAALSPDGRDLLYLNDTSDQDYDLYCGDLWLRNVDRPEPANSAKDSRGVRIDRRVCGDFQFTDDGGSIVYRRDDGGLWTRLAREGERSQKLDSDVAQIVWMGGGRIIYAKEDGDDTYVYYARSLDPAADDRVKIDSGLYDGYRSYVSEDGSRLVCERDGGSGYGEYGWDVDVIYYVWNGSEFEKEKLAAGVYLEDADPETGAVAYLRKEGNGDAPTLFIDDLAEQDAVMEDPEDKDFTLANGDFDWESYFDAFRAYEEKLQRDELREEIAELLEDWTSEPSTLYRSAPGGGEEALAERVYMVNTVQAQGGPVLYSREIRRPEPVRLSEVDEIGEFQDLLWERMGDSRIETYLLRPGEEELLLNGPEQSLEQFRVSENGLYYILSEPQAAYESDGGEGELFYIPLREKGGVPALVGEVALESTLRIHGEQGLLYFTDVDQEGYTGTLWLAEGTETRELAEDVSVYRMRLAEETGRFLYFTDYDNRGMSGTLWLSGEKPLRIADDVYESHYFREDRIYLLRDYRRTAETSDLYLYDKSEKPKRIDSDVNTVWEAEYGWYY